MAATHPPYPREFREVGSKTGQGGREAEVADRPRFLGVSVRSLARWVDQADINAGEQEGLTTDEREELRRLRRENRILKGGVGDSEEGCDFFAQETGRRP